MAFSNADSASNVANGSQSFILDKSRRLQRKKVHGVQSTVHGAAEPQQLSNLANKKRQSTVNGPQSTVEGEGQFSNVAIGQFG
jgi:hypothetical protein